MSLPTSSGGGGAAPGGSARLATAARRLVRPSQMDFEYTAWFAVQLLTAPKTAYRHVAYHRQTKLQWARDDPAFALGLAALTAGVGAAWGVGCGGGGGGGGGGWVTGGLRSALRALLLDFGLVGVLAATAGWAAAAAVGGGGGGGGGGGDGSGAAAAGGVEWLYAFDVHCNASLAALLEVGAGGYILSPWLLRPGTGPALGAAALWAGAALHYSYLTTLGYSAVGPSAAASPEAALYPGMAAAVVLPLLALGGGWNVARFGAGLLFGGWRR